MLYIFQVQITSTRLIGVCTCSIYGDQQEVVFKFVYLGSCVSAGDSVSDEINLNIMLAGLAYSERRHLWCHRDVSLTAKGRVYNALVRVILPHACNIWFRRAGDV